MEASVNLSRRGFFRARAALPPPTRPPWGVAEERFQRLCSRCDACIDTCPTQILTRGDGGFPEVDFSRGECTFCRECVIACKTGALITDLHKETPCETPWQITATISDSCLALQNVVCRSCGDVCEPAAIRFVPQLGRAASPQIDLTRCTGCGACVAPCPGQAVKVAATNHGVPA